MSIETLNLTKELLVKAIDEAKAKGGERNFEQSVELDVTTQGLDLGKPENRVLQVIKLPKKMVKERKVCVFADGAMADRASDLGADLVINRREIDSLAGNKRMVKKISKAYDFFMAEPSLMSKIGQSFGFALGPKGKMPQVVTPTMDLREGIDDLKNSIRIYMRNRPEASCIIGSEKMSSEELAENALAVISAVDQGIRDKARMKHVFVKLTMGEPVKVA